jgi:hypothetical protein
VLTNTTFPNIDQLSGPDLIIMIAGAATPVEPLSWARMGRSEVALPSVSGNIHGVTRNEAFPLPFPIESNLLGYGNGTSVDFDTLTLNLQQEITKDLNFEATYYRQSTDRFIEHTMITSDNVLFVDVNQVLPNGATNPNFGKYYYEARGGPGIIFFQKNELEVARGTLSYEFDSAKKLRGVVGRWLGKHNIAALAEQQLSDTNNVNNAALANLTPEKTTVPRLTGTWSPAPAAVGNRINYRHYYDPTGPLNVLPSLWDKYPRLATAENIGALRNTLVPDANGVTPGFTNNGAPIIQYLKSTAKLVAMQNYLLKDRVITLFGWREDERVLKDLSLTPDAATLLYPSPFGLNARRTWTRRQEQSGKTFNRGVVVVATPWLRLFYNESSSFLPQNPADTDIYDRPILNADGQGTELGIRVALFDGKLNASLSRWTSDMQGQATAVIRNQLGQFNFVNAYNKLWDEAIKLSGDNKYNSAPYRPRQNFTDYLDNAAEGYELSLVANPTPRWRISFNASTQTNHQENLGPILLQYWAQHMPLWRNFPSRDLNGNGVIDVATPATPSDERERFLDRAGADGLATLADTLDASELGVARIVASTGISTTSIPKWSANLVTNYQFTDGRLRGVGIGASLGATAPRTIGYLLTTTRVFDRNRPITGEQQLRTGLWISYARKLDFGGSRKLDWRIQLNVRNVLGDEELEPITGTDDGLGNPFTVRYRIPEPRTFVLTNSFRF